MRKDRLMPTTKNERNKLGVRRSFARGAPDAPTALHLTAPGADSGVLAVLDAAQNGSGSSRAHICSCLLPVKTIAPSTTFEDFYYSSGNTGPRHGGRGRLVPGMLVGVRNRQVAIFV